MSATKLLNDLRAAGLRVVEEPGWKLRGNRWNVDGEPEGICQHHTAPPNPYPIRKLYYGGRIKCNMATHEDGTLYLVAYKACNYSTGRGMKLVLTENVRKNVAPTHNATKSGLKSGNRHFWNYENSHPGDGSPIPQVQLDTIIESSRIVCDHFGITANQIISHAEWTRRKIDPRWNGDNRTAINQIREGVGGDMAFLSDEAQKFFEKTFQELGKLDPTTNETWGRVLVKAHREEDTNPGGKHSHPATTTVGESE